MQMCIPTCNPRGQLHICTGVQMLQLRMAVAGLRCEQPEACQRVCLPAIQGGSCIWVQGYRMPAATGIMVTL